MTASEALQILYSGRVLAPEIAEVLERLNQMFGNQLRVTSLDKGYLQFHVIGHTDQYLVQYLERHQHEAFPKGASHFQVLCPWDRTGLRGVYLYHIPSMTQQVEYKNGFWYY